jgi:hypothetical protein
MGGQSGRHGTSGDSYLTIIGYLGDFAQPWQSNLSRPAQIGDLKIIFGQLMASIIGFSELDVYIVLNNVDLHSKTVVGLPISCV